MESASNLSISRSMAEACGRDIAWLIDSAVTLDGTLALTGWALVTEGAVQDATFRVNGVPFTSVRFPIASPDLAQHFFGVLNSENARFECYIPLADIPTDSHFRFEFVQAGNAARARQTAWWVPAQSEADPLSGERVSRVVGTSDNFSFEMGGATLFHRIQDHLASRFSKRYEDMQAILDWGCGAGRLLSRFASVQGPAIWGSDVDHDNLNHCRQRLPWAQCQVFPLLPPADLQGGLFDLIIGISVCTHLSEDHQRQWLAELRRLSRPGGIVMLSVQGPAQTGLYRESPDLLRKLERSGFVTKGVNPRINSIIGADAYYLDVIQSPDHIRQHWGREFTVLDILPGFAANQDLVVMQAPAAG